MLDCRRLTERIPATPLLVQVWKDTPEGSSIRKLLLSWTAEYMRSSDARSEFAKSLPQEVLSELVVAMSSFDTPRTAQAATATAISTASATPRKNVHYLEDDVDDDPKNKKNRRASGVPSPLATSAEKSIKSRPQPRTNPKPVQKRRISGGYLDPRDITTHQKMEFCADLLTRMLSGPGKPVMKMLRYHC